MKRSTLELFLWMNHLQSLELAIVGITLIMAGFYLPIGHAYMEVELVCYCNTPIKHMFIASGATKVLLGAMTAFWYRKHVDIIPLANLMLTVLVIVFTITIAILVTNNCDSDKAKDRIETLWHNSAYDDNAFFMMQQHLECCGKTGESDYIEKELLPICYKNFDKDSVKFTIGCIDAAVKYYHVKEMHTMLVAGFLAVLEFKGLAISGILFNGKRRVVSISIQQQVTYTS